MNRARDLVLCAAVSSLAAVAPAYPEFQKWSQDNSGRYVNCAMCHAHPDGPEGTKPGQIGSLAPAQLESLNLARRAFEPGADAQSPILNKFGNDILRQLGRREVIALRLDPAALATKLTKSADIDGDGIPDEREYREGTDPLDVQSGNPWELFKVNFARQKFHIAMIVLATAFGLFGLGNLMAGLHRVASRKKTHSVGHH